MGPSRRNKANAPSVNLNAYRRIQVGEVSMMYGKTALARGYLFDAVPRIGAVTTRTERLQCRWQHGDSISLNHDKRTLAKHRRRYPGRALIPTFEVKCFTYGSRTKRGGVVIRVSGLQSIEPGFESCAGRVGHLRSLYVAPYHAAV